MLWLAFLRLLVSGVECQTHPLPCFTVLLQFTSSGHDMKLLKQTLNYVAMLALSGFLYLMAQDVIETTEVFTDYADVAGCPADTRWDYLECS